MPLNTAPRIAPLAKQERSSSMQALLEGVSVAGSEANIFTTLVRAEGLTRKWLPFGGKLLSGKLPPRDRELLILRSAWNCQADYEWAQHTGLGLAAGLSGQEIARIPAGPDAGWEPFDAALLKAADELHATYELSDAVWDALSARYDEAQLIEVPMLVGHYHMVAMALKTLRVQLDSGLTGLPTEPA